MSAPSMKQIIALLMCILGISSLSGANNITIKLDPNNATSIQVRSSDVFKLSLENISSSVTHVIFQAHSQWKELKLSLDPGGTRTQSASGTSVGVLSILAVGKKDTVSYLRLSSQGLNSTEEFTVIVAAWMYQQGDPLPGGCNMEFAMDEDPNIFLLNQNRQNDVKFQYANVGLSKQGGAMANCEDKDSQSSLTYELYQYFLGERDQSEEHWKEAITSMMDPHQIPKIARKVRTLSYHQGKTSQSFGGYLGQGVIYTVLVHQESKGDLGTRRTSAYVTVHTYSCQQGECSTDLVDIVIACIFGAGGLFLAFLGHRFFKCMMFLFGHFALFIVFYVVITRFTTWPETAMVVCSICLALSGGLLWLLFWVFCGIPVLSILVPGLVLGYVMSSLAFNYTPLGVLSWWSTSFNYGMAFSCGILIIPVFLLAFTRVLSILSCTVVGSYLMLFAIDKSYLRGSFQQIIIISFNKATQPGYIQALATVPLQYSDAILLSSWVVLLIVSLVFQWKREKGRPEFPPCPWKEFRHRRQRAEPQPTQVRLDYEDEEEPLLAAHRQLPPTAPPPPYTEHPNVVIINGARQVEPL